MKKRPVTVGSVLSLHAGRLFPCIKGIYKDGTSISSEGQVKGCEATDTNCKREIKIEYNGKAFYCEWLTTGAGTLIIPFLEFLMMFWTMPQSFRVNSALGRDWIRLYDLQRSLTSKFC